MYDYGQCLHTSYAAGQYKGSACSIGESEITQQPRHSSKRSIVCVDHSASRLPKVPSRRWCPNTATPLQHPWLVHADRCWTLLEWRDYWTAAWRRQTDSREGLNVSGELQRSPEDGVSYDITVQLCQYGAVKIREHRRVQSMTVIYIAYAGGSSAHC